MITRLRRWSREEGLPIWFLLYMVLCFGYVGAVLLFAFGLALWDLVTSLPAPTLP